MILITVIQQEVLYPYYAFPLWYLEHSRDITLLIVLQ